MITRRRLLGGLGVAALAAASGGAFALGIEPNRLVVTRYRIQRPPPWPPSLKLKVAVVADLHACEPWMNVARIESIVEATNALGADVIVLLGDYVASHPFVTRDLPVDEWASALGRTRAPLGTYAVLGNHDWWEDPQAQARGRGPTTAGEALRRAGIAVLENEAAPLSVGESRIWLAGLGDQIAFLPGWRRGRHPRMGVDDLAATLASVPEGEPVILLAHEPDIFPQVPARVSLTLSGHTHGGQVRVLGYAPIVPSRYGRRYAYGHVREHTDIIVSGGLGCSLAPVRFGMPPELVLVELAGSAAA